MSAPVYIVDDDEAVRRGLEQLLLAAGFEAHSFASAESFLSSSAGTEGGCIVLDIAMPGMNGLDLNAVLHERGVHLPVIFLTGHGDVPTTVRAMKDGALEFLEKPVAGETLLRAVRAALKLEESRHEDHAERAAARARYGTLTAREREVMALAITGLPNKVIARRLALSHRTVEIHRSRAMRKMQAGSLLELSHAAELCGVGATAQRG